ncbi:hypothetical protein EB810_13975 [Altererythrobacter sp. FM1]|nr:hypothetical protein EB810_13975 [Altererythrobacter sp. FM1]
MQSIIIGLAVGISETTLNSLLVFNEMHADISSNTSGIDETGIAIAIAIGIAAKSIISIIAHGLIFFFSLKLAKGDYLIGFFIAALIHFFSTY